MSYFEYNVNPSKRVWMDGVFLGLAGLLLWISLGLCPSEIPWSSPVSPRKTPSFPPLLLRLTQYIKLLLSIKKKAAECLTDTVLRWQAYFPLLTIPVNILAPWAWGVSPISPQRSDRFLTSSSQTCPARPGFLSQLQAVTRQAVKYWFSYYCWKIYRFLPFFHFRRDILLIQTCHVSSSITRADIPPSLLFAKSSCRMGQGAGLIR